VQEACALALRQWPAAGVSASPGRLAHRGVVSARNSTQAPAADADEPADADDELGLVFMCCHPALEPAARMALTMRCVCVCAETDWRQIAALYAELRAYEPTAVTEANRAVAVAMAESPAAGLAILDALGADPHLARWPQFHIARAELLARAGHGAEAARSYRAALALAMPAPERAFITRRLAELAG
jgi:predicted RNA polymerase sigma factor